MSPDPNTDWLEKDFNVVTVIDEVDGTDHVVVADISHDHRWLMMELDDAECLDESG